jgi:hypothetical protein
MSEPAAPSMRLAFPRTLTFRRSGSKVRRVLVPLAGLALLVTACGAEENAPAADGASSEASGDQEEVVSDVAANDPGDEASAVEDQPDEAQDGDDVSGTEGTLARLSNLDDERRRDANQLLTDPGDDDGPREGRNSVEPQRVVIPTIGVDADVDRVGIDQGIMEVPDHGDAAWFTPSVKPGRVGPSLITGHVSSRADGPDVFYDLEHLQQGDEIEVHGDDEVVVFEVSGVEQHPKEDYPREAVHGATEGPELRLITCGGFFDDASGHHEDNIVVFAERKDT